MEETDKPKEDTLQIEIPKSLKLPNLGTEDKLAIGIIIAAAIVLFYFVSLFQHIPSPIYGGDFYMARGFTQAILNGNPIWQDAYFKGEYAYYAWLPFLLTAGLVKLTGIGLERMSTILPAILQLFYLGACYLFGRALFKSKKYGIIFMLAALSVKFIDMKISGALAMIFMLLALYSFVRYEQGSKRHGWMMGLFMGLTALSHINIFFGLVLIVGTTILVELIIRLAKKEPAATPGPTGTITHMLKVIWRTIKRYIVPILIAAALALLFVGPWLFIYHMNTLNPAQQYSTQDVSKLGLGWVLQVFFSLFIRSGLLNIIYGIIIFFGLVFCIMNRKSQEQRFVLLGLLGATIGAAHFLITIPLLHTWSVPGYLWGAAIWIIELSLFVYGIRNLELMLGKLVGGGNIVVYALLIFIVLFGVQNYSNVNKDQWINYGRQLDSGTQIMLDTGKWMLEATTNSDVFLANDESSFALSAMSGRSVVMVRRTHANYYVDVNKRYADGIVMLYGNNKTKTEELLKEYGVSYVYLDSFLMQYPMITSLKYEQYLIDNGVNYTIQNVHLDPAAAESPTYDSLVILPQELRILGYNITEMAKQFVYTDPTGAQQPQLHSVFLKVTI